MAKGFRSGGRQKGTPNKVTKELRLMIEGALQAAGGQRYLTEQAKKNPKAFLALLGRILPLQVHGAGGGPITVEIVRFADQAPGQ